MIRVAAAIIERDGELLVCRRAPGMPHAGKWEFPGGKAEPGETPEEALRRELVEELGVTADVGPLVWRTVHRYAGRDPVELHFFTVRRLDGEPRNLVFAALRWAPLAELPGVDFLDGDREVVTAIASGRLDVTGKNRGSTRPGRSDQPARGAATPPSSGVRRRS